MPSKKSHIQLYADECFPITSVIHLKSLGYSVVHAFDKKLIQKPDALHLKVSKKLQRVLVTLDRDFLYYKGANLNKHPGVIVISVGSATPIQINKVCTKILKKISADMAKESLLKVTMSKIQKFKKEIVILEKAI